MKLSKQKLIGILIIGTAVLFAVIGWFLLPDTLVVQISSTGQPSNTLPKLPALLIPFAISAVFSFRYMNYEEGEISGKKYRDLILAVTGLAISVLMFVFNLAL